MFKNCFQVGANLRFPVGTVAFLPTRIKYNLVVCDTLQQDGSAAETTVNDCVMTVKFCSCRLRPFAVKQVFCIACPFVVEITEDDVDRRSFIFA